MKQKKIENTTTNIQEQSNETIASTLEKNSAVYQDNGFQDSEFQDSNENVLINCDNLVKLYKTDEVEVMALQGLDMQIEKGELLAIIGKSGSGKSTLLNMLGGLEQPSAGRLYVDGKDLFSLSEKEMVEYRRKTVGFVWQNSGRNLFSYMNVMDNIMAVMEEKDVKKKTARAAYLLEQVGLTNKAKAFPLQLSGGEQQRVAIAVALANEPKLLLADEPTGAVDQKTSKQIQALFRKLNEELGLTIIIVTHDLSLSEQVKRVVMISDGKIGTEKIMRKEYEDALKASEDKIFSDHSFSEDDSHDEYAILDRAGRVQLTAAMREAAGIQSRKVKIRVEGKQIIITSEED